MRFFGNHNCPTSMRCPYHDQRHLRRMKNAQKQVSDQAQCDARAAFCGTGANAPLSFSSDIKPHDGLVVKPLHARHFD